LYKYLEHNVGSSVHYWKKSWKVSMWIGIPTGSICGKDFEG
jgi:hypothetical protein